MASALNIVVIEDHDLLRDATVDALQRAGHRVLGLVCAEDVEDCPQALTADVYVLDLNLPGEDGISLARRLRAAQPRVGIIMATARSQGNERAHGYSSGADIYLSKPVSPEELLAAVDSLARRLSPETAETSKLQLDLQKLTLSDSSLQIRLTHGEAQLLAALARAPERTLERFQVAEHLNIQIDRSQESASLEVRVSNLRKKLEQLGYTESIRAIRNLGYRLLTPIQIV